MRPVAVCSRGSPAEAGGRPPGELEVAQQELLQRLVSSGAERYRPRSRDAALARAREQQKDRQEEYEEQLRRA
ncbi:hypothetical protein [Streptomyces virginiae]|uniref:hypothetical protein n=1 Tax=Streptomyces virginiae TaxID=1961 RepID=UPI0036674543